MSRELARADLSSMSRAQREMLWLRLRAEEVPYWFDGESVVVHAAHAEAVRAAMTWLTHESAPTIQHVTPRLQRQITDDGSIVAPRTRRLVAAWLDGAVFEIVDVTADSLDITPWAAVAACVAYVIGATHLAGQTVGKRIVGIEVVAAGTAVPPSWSRATLRWLTAYAPLIAVVALGSWSLVLVGSAWSVAVYLPILWDRNGQGLHDRVANTYVLRTARGEPHVFAPPI